MGKLQETLISKTNQTIYCFTKGSVGVMRLTRAVGAMTLAMLIAFAGSSVTAKKTTITFAHWYGFNPQVKAYINAAVKEYEKTHPNVEVKQMVNDWGMGYVDKILTMAAAGKAPDVIMISGLLMTSMYGVLSEVDALVDSYGFDKMVSYKPMWRGCTYKGKVYGVPYAGGVQRSMFYNMDMMAQRGWSPEKPPTTWDSFLEFCYKLTYDKNGDNKPDFFATDTSIGMYQMMLVAAGGDYTTKGGMAVDWDSPAGIRALEWAEAIWRSKALGPWGGMLQNKCATYMQGPWEMGTVQKQAKFKWGYTRYPTPTNDNVRLWASVDALGVSKVPPARRKIAWDLVRHLLSPEWQARISAEVGFPPMNKQAFNHPIYKQAVERLPQTHVASEIMEKAFAPDPTPKDGDINAISEKYLWKVMGGGITPKEAAIKMQQEATALLARYTKKK